MSPPQAALTIILSSDLSFYSIDAVKTVMQKRALAGKSHRGIGETFLRLARGPDALQPQPLSKGVMRLYRGLGVSAIRSTLTHGLLWLIIDNVQSFIDRGHLSATQGAVEAHL